MYYSICRMREGMNQLPSVVIMGDYKTFGQENWPTTGKVFVRVLVDACGTVPMSWAAQCPGLAARAMQQENMRARMEWENANIGDRVAVPKSFHPRHGVKFSTWERVR